MSDLDWIRMGFNESTPEDYYAHKHNCYNCGRVNHFFIRKGVPTVKAGLECENCGVVVS